MLRQDFFQKMTKNKKGFTLIELLVVIGVLGAVMAAVTSVLINAFKANTRVKLTDRLSQDGNWALMELRKNIFNAKGTSVTCDLGSSAVSFINTIDGVGTTLLCDEGNNKIASMSGSRADINLFDGGSEVSVSGCSNFAVYACSPTTDVAFSFTLSIGDSNAGSGNYVSKSFDSKVSVRN